jgi:hypothetical protein
MKHVNIFLLLTLISAVVLAQDPKPVKQLPLSHFLENPNYISQLSNNGNPVNTASQGSSRAINSQLIGTSGNAFGTLSSEVNNLDVINSLNTVVFIHRNDPSTNGQTTSQYRYAISTNGGQTFTTQVGPLNPSATGIAGGVNARYPNCVLRNPSGNTDINNAWLVYLGSWHNGNGTGNEIWEGISTGVRKLDGTGGTENNPVINNSDVTITYSLCRGLPGEYWAVGNEFKTDTKDSFVVVYKGVWNTNTNDVDWTVYNKLYPGFANIGDTIQKLSPLIAFDPTGQYGWIASFGNFTTNKVYEPYFYKTTDGGNTWQGPFTMNLSSYPVITNRLDNVNGTGIPTAAFEPDLVVDKNGEPHLFNVVGSGQNYSIQSGLNLNLYDFTYSNSTQQFFPIWVDTILTFRGNVATTSTGNYSQDNRVQASTSPDGSRVIVEWSDSPLNAGGDNTIPDVLACGYNVDTKLWTIGKNFTEDDLTWAGTCTFPSVGFSAFRNGTTTTIPLVITKFNISGSADDPVEFHYFNNISFDDSEFQWDKINSVNNIKKATFEVRVSPNPAVDFITVYSEKLNGSTVRLINVLGQELNNTVAQNQIVQLNLNGLAGGIYFVEVSNTNGTVTKRIIKK